MDKSRLYILDLINEERENITIIVKSKFDLSKTDNWHRIDKFVDQYNHDYGQDYYLVTAGRYHPPKI